jgi:predicted nucleotidyltransferase
MESDLKELVERLKKAYGESLLSVILYGSGAAGDRQPPFSDINIFCVLPKVTPAELKAAETIFRWWRGKGNPAPLLMSEQEVRRSTDCFPMEFHDMHECSRLLYGRDVLPELKIDDRYYRPQVEYELRTKFIRLRQKAAGMMNDTNMLTQLMSDSVATFLVLARHVLRLRGVAPVPVTKRDIVTALSTHVNVDVAPFQRLLNLRSGEKLKGLEGEALFAQYLASVEKLIDTVDAIGR